MTSAQLQKVAPATGMPEAEWAARVELAAAYRLADKMGWSDLISNHISHRVPGHPEQFLINPFGELFEEITASSLVKTDIQGKLLSDSPYPINPAVLVIHAAILEARPEVNCVIHLHTRDGCAVSMQEHGLLPASVHALVIWSRLCYHDYEGVAIDEEEKHSLKRNIGDRKAMILRNHGTLTCGETMGEAFVLMYQLERACRMQVAAQAGSSLFPISQAVIDKSIAQGAKIFGKKGFIPEGQQAWAALLRKQEREDPGYKK
ncbi:MAG: class II aldolase/adducin family protein [Betaproteobacteria bacterium]|nr:class II aldolase/adducin family protein [Betaproteobacteria bacterium]